MIAETYTANNREGATWLVADNPYDYELLFERDAHESFIANHPDVLFTDHLPDGTKVRGDEIKVKWQWYTQVDKDWRFEIEDDWGHQQSMIARVPTRQVATLKHPDSYREREVVEDATDFQSRVFEWVLKCFNPEIAKDILERNDRFIEEALELVQSLGYTSNRAHALVDYVFNREKGEPFQEVGGVMVTLASLCSCAGLDMAKDGETELARINKPEIIEKIRKKQASRPTGGAFPQ